MNLLFYFSQDNRSTKFLCKKENSCNNLSWTLNRLCFLRFTSTGFNPLFWVFLSFWGIIIYSSATVIKRYLKSSLLYLEDPKKLEKYAFEWIFSSYKIWTTLFVEIPMILAFARTDDLIQFCWLNLNSAVQNLTLRFDVVNS